MRDRATIPVLFIGIACASFAIFSAAAFGWTNVYPAVCVVPLFCYPALPTSMVIFSFFMILLVQSYGWKALPFTIEAALSFDFIGSVVGHSSLQLHEFWLIVIPTIAVFFRKDFSLRPNWWLSIYLFAEWQQFKLFYSFISRPSWELAIVFECGLEILWCVAFKQTFLRETSSKTMISQRLGRLFR